MPQVSCKEPNCSQVMSDPCVKLRGLMSIRQDVLQRSATKKHLSNNSILSIDQLLKEELGITEELPDSKNESKHPPTLQLNIFTLECSLGHRHQYSITCQP